MNNFAWWHRFRRHKVERNGIRWVDGIVTFAAHCHTCNFEWCWAVL
jgi:hypothetical protein